MTASEFSSLSTTIPKNPGVYKYYNEAGILIYVGKAKDLRKRVSSYFSKTQLNRKTIELVRKIQKIEFTIVSTEHDALLLENSLIKEFQPHYNINLKDDKTYPYVVIKKENFPRVFFTRRKLTDGSTYFGPYTSVAMVKDLVDMIKENMPLRTCKLNLSEYNIKNKKFKVCLEYHLGRCKGPCEGFQSLEEYDADIDRIKSLLRGSLGPVLNSLKEEMKIHADNMEFEKAQIIRKKIDDLKQYKAKSLVVDSKTGTVDVFSILEEGETAYVNYLAINEGSIIQTKTILLEKKLEETKEEVLSFAIGHIRQTFKSEAKEIIIPFEIEYPEEGVTITIPKSGDKKKLLELSEKNTNYFRSELKAKKMLHLEDKSPEEKEAVIDQLQKDLRMSTRPEHIECFDNSNLHGTHPVAAMVCFRNGEPSKKDYRHFNIKTVVGINDFASMEEVVFRRYSKLQANEEPLPDLVVIDGGKGQLNAAIASLDKLGIKNKMQVIGLAKNQEEIFFPKDSQSLILPWNSESLRLIRRIRDEVHRFGIQFHRSKRTKASVKTSLEVIPGIGPQTAELLMKEYKSIRKIKELTEEELQKLIGKSKTAVLLKAFKAENK